MLATFHRVLGLSCCPSRQILRPAGLTSARRLISSGYRDQGGRCWSSCRESPRA